MPISPVAVASMLATARIGILIISIKQDLHESTIHNAHLGYLRLVNYEPKLRTYKLKSEIKTFIRGFFWPHRSAASVIAAAIGQFV